MKIVLISADGYNGVYEDGVLVDQGKHDYVNIETLIRTYRRHGHDLALYCMSDDVYEEILNGEGYPSDLEYLPLDRLQLTEIVT